jgi:para-aminobenzoate synthetase component I
MLAAEYQFWMGGRLATQLEEVTDDPQRLSDGNLWAAVITFEGKKIFARFGHVEESVFPRQQWRPLSGDWVSNLSRNQYISYVARIREEISQGGVYQVNACRILSHTSNGAVPDLAGLFAELQAHNPSPYSCYLNVPGLTIASASPELFMKRRGTHVKTSPIKGTMRAGEVDFGEKDKAENLMIVDLMRNDFGQISQSGSVEVSQLFRAEQHPGLSHLVSDVRAQLREGVSWSEIITATTPPGSVSGAPKSAALTTISQNEGMRGPYCGALGWIEGDKAELSVGIRIFWSEDSQSIHFGTGAGITWGSDPEHEWEETELKARRLISIAGGQLR